MKVIKFGKKYNFKNPIIILGSFESLHKGHQKLLNKAFQLSRINFGEIVLFAFDDLTLLPKNNGTIFETLDVRLQKFANNKIDAVILAKFDIKFMSQSGDKFITKLISLYNAKNIVCGKDFKYGKLRKWSSTDLKKQFSNTHIIPEYKHNNKKIGTSLIKEFIYYGQLDAANKYLLNDWTTSGLIDNKNIFIYDSNLITLPPGIYACGVEYKNLLHPALVHISLAKKTTILFLEKEIDLQGRKVWIRWQHKIRQIIKNTNDSIMKNDKVLAISWFNSFNK